MPVSKPATRRLFISERLLQAGSCTYDELAAALGVSSMTVRRDVEPMVRQGAVIKTLRGVQKVSGAASDLYETDLRQRLTEHRDDKRLIARRALELVAGRQTIFLDGGTTCLEFARELASQRSGLTAVTNSALACLELGKSNQNMVVGIGGHYDVRSASFVGPAAEEAAGKFFVDLAFISTKAFIADEGTFESMIATIQIKQIVARQAARVILLIDHSKFGRRALSKAIDVAQIHTIVTDAAAPESVVKALRDAGKNVILATTDSVAPVTLVASPR